MVYLGSGELSVDGGETEPCLIDPALPVDWDHPDWSGDTIYYLPSFNSLDPRARASYLAWLAHGRRHANVYIGYAFLFYYGLERRLLEDIEDDFDHPDTDSIVAEIKALLGVYGQSRQFHGYASSLLALVEAVRSISSPLQSVEWSPGFRSAEVPPMVRVGLGRCVADGSPTSAQWALSYLRHHPGRPHRTPEERCRDEFDELFIARYSARFGDGITVDPPERPLVLTYRPASSGMRREVSRRVGSLPEIEAVSGLLNTLRDLAWECIDDLEGYSRFLQRWPDSAGNAVAAALLPEELLESRGGRVFADLSEWMAEQLAGRSSVSVAWNEIVQRWSMGVDRLLRGDVVLVASLFAKLGVGMEPDVRFGGLVPSPGSNVVLFALPDGATAVPSPGYAAASALVHLAAIVAAADGTISVEERQRLAEHLECGLRLDAAECARLEAHLEYLATGALDTADTMRRVGALAAEQRSEVGVFLVDVAAADGRISPEEVETLMTLFEHLGLSQAELFGLLKVRAARDGDPGPVAVTQAQPGREWAVPEPPEKAPPAGLPLDSAAIERRLAEDARARALLDSIFADETELEDAAGSADEPISHDAPPSDADESESPTRRPDQADVNWSATADHDFDHSVLPMPISQVQSAGLLVWGLDVEHWRLAVALTTEPRWSRVDVEDLARPIGLGMLNGAIDMINEAAIENCDEPLLEGDDPLKLNVYAATRLVEEASDSSDAAVRAFDEGWRWSANLVMGIEPGDTTPGMD